MRVWWHGGVPGLCAGGLIEPGHERATQDGCPWCAARANGEAGPGGIDCAHLILKDGPALGAGAGRWWKCTRALKDGRGPDIVRSWPSCTARQQREEET